MKNPAAALDALVHPAAAKVGRFELHEPTLGMLALLERIGSPLMVPSAAKSLEAWAETLFSLTRPASESRALLAQGRDVFSEAAAAWADGISNAEAAALMQEAAGAVARMNDANPTEASAEDGQSAADPTAGGPMAG